MLRKYISDPSHILSYETLDLSPNLTYQQQPVKILDRQEKILRTKRISLVKVLWRSQKREEITWEKEDEMRSKYPTLFGMSNFEDEILLRGKEM